MPLLVALRRGQGLLRVDQAPQGFVAAGAAEGAPRGGRLAENHGINLYTDPAAARRVFCRSGGDEALWRWVDPAQALSTAERERERRGISHRTLTRLVNRLEQL